MIKKKKKIYKKNIGHAWIRTTVLDHSATTYGTFTCTRQIKITRPFVLQFIARPLG